MDSRRWALLLLTLAVGCASVEAAQFSGQVRAADQIVPGATVTAVQGGAKVTAFTDENGRYTLELTPGVWQIEVSMFEFTTAKGQVTVSDGPIARDWMLNMPKLSERGGPAADASGVAAPLPAAPGIGRGARGARGNRGADGQGGQRASGNFPGRQGRGGPGGQAAADAAAGTGGRGAGRGAPGQAQAGFQSAAVRATPEGQQANAQQDAPVNIDLGDADESLLVNGSVSNGVERRAIGNNRKGPGSAYRGDINSILDSSALDARSYSITGQNMAKPSYYHLRYGATFGGPLSIPHLFRTNNGNFFVAYQGTRNRNASTQTNLMPTALERGGDFSQTLNPAGKPVQAIDPLTVDPVTGKGTPFPGNVIPAARIANEATNLLHFYPQPNFNPSARYNYQIPLVGTSGADALQARVNKAINPRNSINGTFGFQRTGAENPNLFEFVDGNHTLGMSLNVSWRHTFNKTLYGTLGAQYSRYSARNTPYWAYRSNVSEKAGIGGNNQDPENWGPPSLSFNSGYAGLSDGQESFLRNQTSAISYSVMWLKRPHNITMGGDVRRIELNQMGQQDARGTIDDGTARAAP